MGGQTGSEGETPKILSGDLKKRYVQRFLDWDSEAAPNKINKLLKTGRKKTFEDWSKMGGKKMGQALQK